MEMNKLNTEDYYDR